MAAYRFCRTDDVGLLVDALNRCWVPFAPGESAVNAATFKRSIRDLQVWCSSCMVAFSGADPIGVLIGAKRPSGTLVHRIAVHPEHRRQGHGRHLLDSLAAKLAILGPPRIVAEIPEDLAAARRLFDACGFVEETRLVDYTADEASPDWRDGPAPAGDLAGRFVIPVTIDDLAANGLLGEDDPQTCWHRSVESLTAAKDDIEGRAIASEERLEAYVLYVPHGRDAEIVSLRSCVDDGGTRLRHLLSGMRAAGLTTFRMSKVHPAEMPGAALEALGFRPAGLHRRYETTARPDEPRRSVNA